MNKAFHFLQSTISFLEHDGVTIRGLWDSHPLTYEYNLDEVADEDIDTGLLWQCFTRSMKKFLPYLILGKQNSL